MAPSPSGNPARPLALTTADAVTLSGLVISGPRPGPAVVIGHGFTNSTQAPGTRLVIDRFARHTAVFAIDFRGHGQSGGRTSVGRDEHLDLDAAVAAAREAGYGPVTVVGFSMGASVALRHAALGEHRPDAVVSVSAPSRWFIRETVPMRRVHWLLEHPLGPLVGRAIGVRLATPWPDVPATPLELIDHIAPIPLLLVHGALDHYFGPAHAVALQAASNGHAELWIEPGMGHAESGSTPELIDRIANWIATTTGPAGPGGAGTAGDISAPLDVPLESPAAFTVPSDLAQPFTGDALGARQPG